MRTVPRGSAAIVITAKPAALDRKSAAAYLSISETQLERQTQHDPAFPKPVELSARRVGWLTHELDEWLFSRPRSSKLPPENSGIGSKGKAPALD